ncbi:hypothetical protein N9972_00485 [bacterium]|nr:hypothetical protein [bacterium]MDA8968766.1 hypothetical protein [Akkermansiaceae bacterium]MDB4318232.1 hypothetical protein [bacterium]
MKNTLKIKTFQNLPSSLRSLSGRILAIFKQQDVRATEDVVGVNHFNPGEQLSKRALLVMSPQAWFNALRQHPNIKMFNFNGLVFETVNVLNNHKYLVDIVDYRTPRKLSDSYDLVVAHGGNCAELLDELSQETPVLQYVSGAYWPIFNEETKERYQSFCERRNVKESLSSRRSLDGLVEGEVKLTERANKLFSIGLPRMISSFGAHSSKFVTTGLGAYLDHDLLIRDKDRDFKKGRKGFIYVGGTGGNIQKGLDLLIEAFSMEPDLQLYIYCKVESEVVDYCAEFLNAPNVHYVYHLRNTAAGKRRLLELMGKICFTVHAPINTGLGTAFSGSVGLGLIPAGYVDLPHDDSWNVLSDSWDPSDLAKIFKRASEKSEEWCRNASNQAIQEYLSNWTAEAYHLKFDQLVSRFDESN